MATKKKLLEAAAGSAGGATLNVEDVFSTYLYDGNATARSIVNGIDLAGEGGLVWIKARGAAYDNVLFDTERGANQWIRSNNTGASATYYSNTGLTSFNSDGFSLGTDPTGYYVNQSAGGGYASWTFRKAPKFFDVVTYTGTGANHTISHGLGSVPAFIITKRTDTSGLWLTWHHDFPDNYMSLNNTWANQPSGRTIFVSEDASSFTLSSNANVNASGGTYVAYLFAHNDGDGEFGPTGDQDIIKCGLATEASGTSAYIDLGFEPQWILYKGSSVTGNWFLYDTMRGLHAFNIDNKYLTANTSSSENNIGNYISPTPTGFRIEPYDGAGSEHVYIAIRRGPMAVPESGADVFAIDTRGSSSGEPGFKSGFVIDTFIDKIVNSGTSGFAMSSRLTQGKFVQTQSTAAEGTQASYQFDYMNGFGTSTSANANYYAWMWKRAPSFFDSVCYTGNDTAGHTINHNLLGVAPEMIWVKSRSSALHWFVYHSALTSNGAILLSSDGGSFTGTTYWNNTDPTSSDFTLGTSVNVNGSAKTYIAYLFASLAGISKVGSYTGNGSTQTIDCGFSSGARFVLIKRTDSTGDWYVWDTERGIVAANDPHLSLNTTAAQVTTNDSIDPVSSGFSVNQVGATNINVSSASYIFYAIA